MSREKPFLSEDKIIHDEAFEAWLSRQTLFDDSFFTVFFHNKSVATSMVRTLLESEEVRLAHSATQVEFRNPGFKREQPGFRHACPDGGMAVNFRSFSLYNVGGFDNLMLQFTHEGSKGRKAL